MKKLVIPKFESDDQEAIWWYDHRAIVEANLSEALRNGAAGRGTMARVIQEAHKPVALVVPPQDLERARKLARRKKTECRSYLLKLIHDALDREEAAGKRAARR